MIYEYPVVLTLHDDASGYLAEVPDIDYCASSGKTIEEAIDMIADALSLMIVSMEDDGDEIPPPSDIAKIRENYTGIVTRVMVDIDEYRAMLEMYPFEDPEDEDDE